MLSNMKKRRISILLLLDGLELDEFRHYGRYQVPIRFLSGCSPELSDDTQRDAVGLCTYDTDVRSYSAAALSPAPT